MFRDAEMNEAALLEAGVTQSDFLGIGVLRDISY